MKFWSFLESLPKFARSIKSCHFHAKWSVLPRIIHLASWFSEKLKTINSVHCESYFLINNNNNNNNCYVILFCSISPVKHFLFDIPPQKNEIDDDRCQSMITDDNWWKSMAIDNNWWQLKNTNFLAIDWLSISDINWLIVIDCHWLSSIVIDWSGRVQVDLFSWY